MANAVVKLRMAPAQTGADLIELLDRTARQDRAAFALLYQATSLKLFGVILRILKRKQIAEDVLQDTYIKIWEKAGDFDAARGSAIAWMAAIARHRALDEVRRPAALSSADMADFENIAAPDLSALDRLVDDEAARRLAHCLGIMESDKREMILLAYHHGMSREILAQRFGHPAATIKTWLRRGLETLKQCLES